MSQSIASAITEAAGVLREAGIAESRREAGSLLANVVGQDRTFLITHSDKELTAEQLSTFRQQVVRRAAGEPLQYITGIQEFFGLAFEVDPEALIPRPETELLVETALELINGRGAGILISDVGTGTGCIPISLLHERPLARAVAVDLSPAAICVAARNAARHSVSDRISFVVADSLSAFEQQPRFDLIVSNPPYIADRDWQTLQREVRDYEPRLALTSGNDGLDMIRRLLIETPNVLINGGYFLFEIGYDQAAAVEKMIDRRAWKATSIRNDLQGIPRTVVLQRR